MDARAQAHLLRSDGELVTGDISGSFRLVDVQQVLEAPVVYTHRFAPVLLGRHPASIQAEGRSGAVADAAAEVTTSERQSAEDETAAQRRGTSARRDNVWCWIENFLPAAEHEQLLGAALAREEQFTASTTTSGDTGASAVTSDRGAAVAAPRRVPRRDRPGVARGGALARGAAVPCLAGGRTAHDARRWRLLPDARRQRRAEHRAAGDHVRVLRPSRAAALRGRRAAPPGPDDEVAAVVAPLGNSVVFFASGRRHEVRQVRNDGTFANGRFTVNGWLYR